MKKNRLKPYVYKVEGAVNFALYNILRMESIQRTWSPIKKYVATGIRTLMY